MTKQNRARLKRDGAGFALVSIIVLGVFAIGTMLAMFPAILNIVRNESSGRYMNELRSAAESGIDYGIEQLNSYTAIQQPCPIDLTTSTVVPASYLGNFTGGTVKITLRQLSSTDWSLLRQYSTIYATSLDPQNGPLGPFAKQYQTGSSSNPQAPIKTSIQSDYWRVLESTATKGSFSRSVRVFLEPRFDIPPGENLAIGNPSESYFQNSLFGNSKVALAPTGPLSVYGPDQLQQPNGSGKYTLQLQSNRYASLGGNVTLWGDLVVSNGINGVPSQVASLANPATTTVEGRVLSNGGLSSTFFGDPTNVTPDYTKAGAGQTLTVFANADLPNVNNNERAGLNLLKPTDPASDSASLAFAPAQTSSNASSFPDLSVTNSLQGQYSSSSLTLDGSNGIGSVTAPTQIYIQDGASSANAADIKASTLVNSPITPENLQIWYSGNRPVNIHLDSNFSGTVYAPNAPVTLDGNGSFFGALVGDQINMNNSGTVQISTNLQKSSQAATCGLAFTKASDGSPLLQGYKAVTWQELKTAIVP